MFTPDLTILYVTDAEASARFYTRLLGREPVEASPGFALFVFEGGHKLGLWRRDGVVPPATMTGGGTELCFLAEDDAALEACHAEWVAQGLKIIQAPVAMEFGTTFTALDPDGHRLRVRVREG
ncbi:VOC family protein [Acetobacteraceae bacterium H6797]|nr:VOC family protein [Acetobacteraceae bacterium H6797]